MRFQTKIIVGYAVFVFALALIIGFAYHSYTVNQFEQAEESNMKIVADQLVAQMDERISRMELVTEYILSDPEMLEGMQMLARASAADQYMADARAAIQKGINTYYITNNFYRAVVFNQNGDVFSTYNPQARKARTDVDFAAMDYLKEAEQNKGRPVLVSTHQDPWGVQNNPQVFSLLKTVQGTNMGYIEVQYQISDLAEMQIPKEEISYLIYINDGEFLYSNRKDENGSSYDEFLDPEQALSGKYNTADGAEILLARSSSRKYPVTVLAVEGTAEIKRAGSYNTPMTLAIALMFFLVSMVFVILLSQVLTKPLRQLQQVMENTRLENLGESVAVNAPNDEIRALSVSYQDVMGRLRESMVKEQRLSVLQLQAQFDSLQAQVNPHFLYNVLNIISARGMSGGDEKICEMCQSLASMLRYSTNNKNRYATIREELTYLDQYFYLLKARYEHKIVFRVQADETIMNELIPKVALQQIVENCINHGFVNSTEIMEVEITGWCEAGYWYIKVQDNGQGFAADVLEELEEKMSKTKRRLLEERSNMELEIGGMGLINTYARCLLMYNDKLVFKMQNSDKGAVVILGTEIREEE